MLTALEIDFVARRASFWFNCLLKPNAGRYSPFSGDYVVFVGDGVDDLDHVASRMLQFPNGTFEIDVGRTESAYRAITSEELAALRAKYVEIWGEVNKPGLWEPSHFSL